MFLKLRNNYFSKNIKMGMGEKMNYLPDGLIPDEVGEESDRINQMLDNSSGMAEAIKILESTMLDERFVYYPQIGTIRECLKQAFGDRDHMVKITNKFLSILEDFMDALKELKQKGSNDEKIRYNSVRSELSTYLYDYGKEFYDKLREDNTDLGISEFANISNKYDDEFIQLLQEKLTYVPSRKLSK